jgi:hypothetical protein
MSSLELNTVVPKQNFRPVAAAPVQTVNGVRAVLIEVLKM